jgi:undecaprenyl-diphosphatase
MDPLNHSLFLLLNAPAHPGTGHLWLARLLAEDLIFLLPAGLVAGWLWGRCPIRLRLLEASTAVGLGLLLNAVIALLWPQPRPFVAGIGHTLLAHVADPSFPSDHATVMLSAGFALLLRRPLRAAGLALTVAAIATAWARVYLGVHFPLDIAGSAAVAALSAGGVVRYSPRFMPACYGIVLHVYHSVFGPLIRRGLFLP